MKFFKKKETKLTYDAEKVRPVIRRSICTGEATAGFQNLETKRFEEVMLIRDREDLREFMNKYDIHEMPDTIY